MDYAGHVFLFAGEEPMRRFCQWPKRFLCEEPRINAPGGDLEQPSICVEVYIWDSLC